MLAEAIKRQAKHKFAYFINSRKLIRQHVNMMFFLYLLADFGMKAKKTSYKTQFARVFMSLNRPIKLTEHGNKIHIKLFNKNIYTAKEKFWQKKKFWRCFLCAARWVLFGGGKYASDRARSNFDVFIKYGKININFEKQTQKIMMFQYNMILNGWKVSARLKPLFMVCW